MSFQIKILKALKNKCPICQSKLKLNRFNYYLCSNVGVYHHSLNITNILVGQYDYNEINFIHSKNRNLYVGICFNEETFAIGINFKKLLKIPFDIDRFKKICITQETIEKKIDRMLLLK
jgi:hypothetical protein